MVITNYGISGATIRLGAYNSGAFWIMLGSVSGTTAVTTSGIYGGATNMVIMTGSMDISVVNRITIQGDFDSVSLSGVNMKQFGFQVGSSTVHELWQIEGVSGVQFDGTNELQVEFTWRVFGA